MSVTCAPRARMAVNAWWPGVSMNVTCLASPVAGDGHVEGGDVLGDAAALAGDDVGVADLVSRSFGLSVLAVVDVPEDRHDRRAVDQVLRGDLGLDALEPLGQTFLGRGLALDLDVDAELDPRASRPGRRRGGC